MEHRAIETPDAAARGARAAAGLSQAEAEARRARDGANEVPEKRPNPLARLARKFWGLSAWMLELIAVLSLISLSTDRVHPSQYPETWKIGPLVNVAVVLGVLMLVEALGLLAIGWHRLRLDQSSGQLQTFSFLTLLFFALFSIVSIRERRAFWMSRPAPLLALALAADATVGVVVGAYGLAELRPLPVAQTGLIASYALVCCLGPNDVIKSWLIARFWTAAHDIEAQPPGAAHDGTAVSTGSESDACRLVSSGEPALSRGRGVLRTPETGQQQ